MGIGKELLSAVIVARCSSAVVSERMKDTGNCRLPALVAIQPRSFSNDCWFGSRATVNLCVRDLRFTAEVIYTISLTS
ncbi:unnamed protein product [Toxocara canis]|uniref:Secreted protein n=1 Tax=Toxocara canis TaxID=6265 RepID=A0A183V0L7_TOXCA|nr:unnamed protein product [Toxocara canis]